MLRDNIAQDLVVALKARDRIQTGFLRIILNEVGKKAKDQRISDLPEEEILGLLSKLKKQNQESLDYAQQVNRADLIEKLQREQEILEKYLPAQMSESEIRAEIEQVISEEKPKNLGMLMKGLSVRLKGKADMKVVSAIAKNLL